jgi:A/G-specific adenine glycosylase
VRHGFTHCELDLRLLLYSGDEWARLDPDGGTWWPLEQIEQAGLPTLFAKAARLALAEGGST